MHMKACHVQSCGENGGFGGLGEGCENKKSESTIALSSDVKVNLCLLRLHAKRVERV